jgi:hypothetical protein
VSIRIPRAYRCPQARKTNFATELATSQSEAEGEAGD